MHTAVRGRSTASTRPTVEEPMSARLKFIRGAMPARVAPALPSSPRPGVGVPVSGHPVPGRPMPRLAPAARVLPARVMPARTVPRRPGESLVVPTVAVPGRTRYSRPPVRGAGR
jgi:hypothetical protein